MENQLHDLPDHVKRTLENFAETVKKSCGENLVSLALFGSAAEGRMRPTSDVNLILVIKRFERSQIDGLRESLRLAHAAAMVQVMFILESEIPTAAEAFAVKFSDIHSRHRVLVGTDPFQKLEISREAKIQRMQQVVVNLMLRLRERYALLSLREEQLNYVIADVAGPVRAIAATILSLEGRSGLQPKEALQILTQKIAKDAKDELLSNISKAREERELEPDVASETLLGIHDLLVQMNDYIKGMR